MQNLPGKSCDAIVHARRCKQQLCVTKYIRELFGDIQLQFKLYTYAFRRFRRKERFELVNFTCRRERLKSSFGETWGDVCLSFSWDTGRGIVSGVLNFCILTSRLATFHAFTTPKNSAAYPSAHAQPTSHNIHDTCNAAAASTCHRPRSSRTTPRLLLATRINFGGRG